MPNIIGWDLVAIAHGLNASEGFAKNNYWLAHCDTALWTMTLFSWAASYDAFVSCRQRPNVALRASLSEATFQYLSNAFSPDILSNNGSEILEYLANKSGNLAKTACQITRWDIYLLNNKFPAATDHQSYRLLRAHSLLRERHNELCGTYTHRLLSSTARSMRWEKINDRNWIWIAQRLHDALDAIHCQMVWRAS